MAKASERLQVHPTSVTNAVDRLEAAGLVRRLAHPTDGATTLVEITAEGRDRALAQRRIWMLRCSSCRVSMRRSWPS